MAGADTRSQGRQRTRLLGRVLLFLRGLDDAVEIIEGTGEPDGDEDEPYRQDAIDDYFNRLESDKS